MLLRNGSKLHSITTQEIVAAVRTTLGSHYTPYNSAAYSVDVNCRAYVTPLVAQRANRGYTRARYARGR